MAESAVKPSNQWQPKDLFSGLFVGARFYSIWHIILLFWVAISIADCYAMTGHTVWDIAYSIVIAL